MKILAVILGIIATVSHLLNIATLEQSTHAIVCSIFIWLVLSE